MHHRYPSLVLATLLLTSPLLAYTVAVADPIPTSDSLYQDAFHLLAAGQQVDAEHLLLQAVKRSDTDPRLAFFNAACTRSRFEIQASLPLFKHVIELEPAGRYGQTAARILLLDAKHGDPQKLFAELAALAAKFPDEPLITWMAAVQCRSLHKPAEGIAYYASLANVFQPGPSLYHQTYANLLDEAKRFDEALPHRQLAVQLEPTSWSYEALGNTLTSLHQWAAADQAFAQALPLHPIHTAHIYSNWTRSLRLRGDWLGVIEKCSAGTAADPTNAPLWIDYADAQAHLHHDADALACYARAIALSPDRYEPYEQAAPLLDRTGQSQQAQVYRQQAKLLRPHQTPTTADTR